MSDGLDPDEPASEVDPAVRPGLLQRLLPPVDQHGEDGQPKPSRMAPREQLVAAGLGFANVAIVAGTASSVQDQQALVLLAGLLASVITVVGARVGNRLLGMVGLFAATLVRPSSAAIFLAVVLPYYAAAMWMFLRYNRMMKAQNIARRQQRIEARGAGGGGGSSRARGAGRPGRSGSGTPPTRALPTASKRYTPPKPTKKRPPPSAKPPKDRSPVD